MLSLIFVLCSQPTIHLRLVNLAMCVLLKNGGRSVLTFCCRPQQKVATTKRPPTVLSLLSHYLAPSLLAPILFVFLLFSVLFR